MKQMVTFDGIISALTSCSYASSQAMMCALIERWMDTTHSFYLPFEGITITPLDFAAIIGLSFSREPIPVSNEAHSSTVVRNRLLKDLFGATASVKSDYSSLVLYTQLVDKVRSGYDAGCVSLEQLA